MSVRARRREHSVLVRCFVIEMAIPATAADIFSREQESVADKQEVMAMTQDNQRSTTQDAELSSGGARPILRGFVAALRDKDFFHLLNDIFTTMDPIQKGLEPKLPRLGHHFIVQNYGQDVGILWEAIKIQYQSFITSTSVAGATFIAENQTSEDVAAAEAKRDQLEADELRTRFQSLFPEAIDSPYRAVTSSFVTFFERSPGRLTSHDRHLCTEALQRICLTLASHKSVAETEMRKKDQKGAHDSYMKRQNLVAALFSRVSTDFVAANSATMKSLLLSRRGKTRARFYDGGRPNSLDGELGGFHGAGLTCFIGGTSGFKTGVMTSLIANHMIRYVDQLDDEPVDIWCYIGEDGEEAYPRRILVNIINRIAERDDAVAQIIRDARRDLTVGHFDHFLESSEFMILVDELLKGPLSGLHIIRAPATPEKMASFSIMDVLNIFESRISSTGKKPRLVVLDYLNLLKLPRGYAFNNRAEEISSISHILDEWGNHHKIPIITAAQASADGNVRAREIEFYNQEHIHECRSVQHHARMMISLLTYDDPTAKDSKGRPVDRMALKILKNRDGRKGDIFRTGLDFAKNITLVDSERLSEEAWRSHVEDVKAAKAAIVEGNLTGAGPGYGGQRGGAGAGGSRGAYRPPGRSSPSFSGHQTAAQGGRGARTPSSPMSSPMSSRPSAMPSPPPPGASTPPPSTLQTDGGGPSPVAAPGRDESDQMYFDEFTIAE